MSVKPEINDTRIAQLQEDLLNSLDEKLELEMEDRLAEDAPRLNACVLLGCSARPQRSQKTQWHFQRCVSHLPAWVRHPVHSRHPVPPEIFIPEKY